MEHPAQDHGHHRGLAFDLATLGRRRTLALLGGGASQLGTTTGSVDEGYAVELRVGVGRP